MRPIAEYRSTSGRTLETLYPGSVPSPPIFTPKPDPGLPGLYGTRFVPVASNCRGVPADVVMTPYCVASSFVFGRMMNCGSPFPAPPFAVEFAGPLLAIPQFSAHQSRLYEQGPMLSCFWYSMPAMTWPRPSSPNAVPHANEACVSPPSLSAVWP